MIAFEAGADECSTLRGRVLQMCELFDAVARAEGADAAAARDASEALNHAERALLRAEAVLARAAAGAAAARALLSQHKGRS